MSGEVTQPFLPAHPDMMKPVGARRRGETWRNERENEISPHTGLKTWTELLNNQELSFYWPSTWSSAYCNDMHKLTPYMGSYDNEMRLCSVLGMSGVMQRPRLRTSPS